MSDSLVRLKVNSSEWDSKLKNASDQLNRYMEGCRKAGGTLEVLDEGVMDVVKSFGKMETASNTARGRIAELTKSFTDLSFQYKQMSDAEKQSEPGKALRESLDQLKYRIIDAKKDLSDINAELSETGKASNNAGTGLGSLNSIFGASITKLAGWGAAIAAAKGALDVAKDAFFASEANIDTWGRTVEAAETLYESFLTSINTGDIGGFLNKIDQITTAAYEAYNALDQLNTQKTIQIPELSAKQAEVARMRSMLQSGRYIAPADGRTPTNGMNTGDKLSEAQLKRISQQLESAMKEIANITASQVKSATNAIDKLYNEQAAVLGISKKKFLDATSSWEKFQDALDKGAKYQTEELQKQAIRAKANAGINITKEESAILNRKNPYQEWSWVQVFKDDGERFKRIIDEIQKRDSASSQLYSQYGQAYRRINRVEGVNPYGSTGGGSSDKTNTELKQNEAAIAKLTEQYQKLATEAKTADDAQRAGISTRMNEIQGEIKLFSDRNAELKRFAAEAQGMKVSVGISSSLPELNEQLKQLQQAQSQALNNADWTAYGKQIEQVQAQIEAFKGKWREGLQATFQIKAEAEVPETKTVTFRADDTDVLEKARQISGVHIDDKTLTVTALTEDAEVALRNLDGMKPQPKFLTVTALTAEAEETLRKMGAEHISDKTFRVTAEMADTLTQLQDVNAYKISDKEVTVNAETQAAIDKLKDIEGVTFDPKTLTVTANTAEAYNKCQEIFNDIEGATVEFAVVPSQSDLTNNNLATIISDIKKQIDRAEIGSSLYNNLTARLADANAIGNLIRTAVQNGLDTSQLEIDDFWKNIIKGEDIPDTQLQTIVDRINEYLKDKHIELNFDVGTVTEKKSEEGEGEGKPDNQKSKWKKSQVDENGNPYAIYGVGKMGSGISSLVSSVEQLGIELPQGLKDIFGGIQAVTSILTSIMTIVEAIEMLSSATSFLPFFAKGGIVPHAAAGAFIGGNHYSGDVTPVLANAGEVILNKAAQGNLVSQLQDNERQTGGNTQPFVTGEQIYLGLNNYLRRTGRGELMTARS